MKKTCKLEGLDCANCAAKMEQAIRSIDGVKAVSINVFTSKMVLEGEDATFDAIMKAATDSIRKIEPHVIVKKA